MAMMSSTKLDVVWSPVHPNNFVIWGSDITLYEVARLQDIDKNTTFQQISPTKGATVVASQSAGHVRCVDICAMQEHTDPLLAVGYSSGKVLLTTLKQTQEPKGLAGREFVPRYQRLCNSVAWSHNETNLLACGLEKHKSDHSILLWDVNRAADEALDAPAGAEPLAELGLSETAHSVSWARSAPRTLLASMDLKYIKMFDLRDLSNKAVTTTTTRYCYNACADPFNEYQIASRGDNMVCVWDLRSPERPVLALAQPRPVTRVQWCSTRRNLLLSLQRDAPALRLHEIQPASDRGLCEPLPKPDSDVDVSRGVGPSVLERDVTPQLAEPAPLATFAWHPCREAQLLAVAQTGAISSYTVSERVTVSWGALGGLAWSGGGLGGVGGRLLLLPPAFYEDLADISHLITRRANNDYGLKPDLWENAELAEDETLSSLWHFLALSKSLVEDGCIRNCQWKHPGVRAVLGAPDQGYRSEIVPTVWPDMPNRRIAVYRSGSRARSLMCCGWGWGWENAGAGVERLQAAGEHTRAALTAALHLRLRHALDVLAHAPHPQLQLAALALAAGLGEEPLWRDTAALVAPQVADANLRAALHFLRAIARPQPNNAPIDFSDVLKETEMRLEDRIAFACIYLPDARLHEYVAQCTDELVAKGDLAGILLTGTSPEGVKLLQRYLENTGDVQTAALVAARCFSPELLKRPDVQAWLDSYRTILNRQRLYAARCGLDAWSLGAEERGGAGRRVAVACAYCGKAVAAHAHPMRARHAFARVPPPPPKMKHVSSCPSCRKPLPRCGICHQHLGGAGADKWFSFCASCRHGGHADHMQEWFRTHHECPVNSCTCRCNMKDPLDPDQRFQK